MLFYHFTCLEHWPSILESGLSKGEAPTSWSTWENAVNLTTSPTPEGHGLSTGEPIPEDILDAYRKQHGELPKNSHWANKTAIRVKVKILSSDKRLVKWTRFIVNRRVHPLVIHGLHKHAPRYDRFWLFFGVIPASEFIEVAVQAGGNYVPWPSYEKGVA